MPPVYGFAGYPTPPSAPRRDSEGVLGAAHAPSGWKIVLLCWVLGAAASELLIFGGLGLSVPLLVAGFYAIAFWYWRDKKKSHASLLLLIPVALLALCFVLVDSGITRVINFLVLAVVMAIQVTAMSGRTPAKLFSLPMAGDAAVSVVGKPVAFLDMPFRAFFRKGRKSEASPRIVLGLLCAVPVALIFVVLFSLADARFSALMGDILRGIRLGNVATDVILGAIAALYFSALFLTLKGRTAVRENTPALRGISGTAIAAFLIPINLIQLLFVGVQFSDLFGRVEDALLTQTARGGFFELCWAVGIAAAIICLALIFCKKAKGGRLPKAVSALLTLLIVCNYVIAASSMYKMIRYIQRYDLTVKRVATMWLMALFVLCFVGALIRVWAPKFRASLWVAVCVIVMALGLNSLNMDAFIARYNVNQYLNSLQSGTTATLDIGALQQLSPAAAPEVARLIEEQTPAAAQARDVLSRMAQRVDAKSWRNYMVSDSVARAVFEEYGIR